MSPEKRKDLYDVARIHWGFESQCYKLGEECCELTRALLRHKMGLGSMLEVMDEIADVEIMIEQFRNNVGEARDRIDSYKERKLLRLKERLAMEAAK